MWEAETVAVQNSSRQPIAANNLTNAHISTTEPIKRRSALIMIPMGGKYTLVLDLRGVFTS